MKKALIKILESEDGATHIFTFWRFQVDRWGSPSAKSITRQPSTLAGKVVRLKRRIEIEVEYV
jgi:hypothetical protein